MDLVTKKLNTISIPYRLLFATIFLLAGLILVLLKLNSTKPQTVEAGWFDDSWRYRASIGMTSSAALTDFQVSFTLDTATLISASKMKTDCSDIRVTDQSGKLLPSWVETGVTTYRCNQATTKVWVRVPSIPSGAFTLFTYYGNPQASKLDQSSQVFLFFDNFETFSGWNTYGNGLVTQSSTTAPAYDGSYTGYKYNAGDPAGACKSLGASYNFSDGYVLEAKHWRNSNPGSNADGIYLEDSSYNGYGSNIPHTVGQERTVIDIRTAGVASAIGNTTMIPTLPMSTWYGIKLISKSSNRFELHYLDSSETVLNTGTTATDATYSSFNQVCIQRGYDYYTDHLLLRRYAASDPTVSATGTEEQGGGPIAYWKFDEGVGASAYNSGSLGSSLNGTLASIGSLPSWTSGRVDKAISFNGDDYISAPKPMSQIDNWTLSAWVNPSNLTQVESSVVYVGDDSAGYGFNVGGPYGDNGKLYGLLGFVTWVDAGYTFPSANRWYHIVMKRDNGTISFYVDGKKTSGESTSVPNTPSNFFEIGHVPDYFGRYFEGKIDDVKIYNYPRTAEQIKTDYNSYGNLKGSAANLGVATTASGAAMSGYWTFNEGTGTTVYDTSGNNLNAGWSGTVGWTNGQYGKAGLFNGGIGISSFTITSSTLAYAPTTSTPFTFSAWVKPTVVDSISRVAVQTTDGSGTGRTMLGIFSNNQFYTAIGGTTVSVGVTAVANTWYHIGVVYSGVGETFYINGVGVTTANITVEANSGKLVFGAGKTLGSTPFYGAIDDVRYYNYARSAPQMVEDMNAGRKVNNPYIHYKFDEGKGTTAKNSGTCGSTCDATFATGSSAPSWSTDAVNGTSLSFAGNDYLSSTVYASLASNFTVSYWFKTIVGATAAYPVELQYGSPNLTLSSSTLRRFAVTIRNAADTAWISTPSPNDIVVDSKWQQITATYANNDLVTLYYNGKNVGSSSIPGQGGWGSSKSLVIGGRDPTFYIGNLDEIKVYNYALNDEEVKLNYNQGQAQILGSRSTDAGGTGPTSSYDRTYCVPGDTSTCSPPVGEWKMDEGRWTNDCSTTTVYDTSGNGFNGLACGSAQTTAGKEGKAGLFTSSLATDYLSIPDSGTSSLDVTTYTISGWINVGTGSSGSRRTIIVKGRHDTSPYRNYNIEVNGSNQISASYEKSDGTDATGVTSTTVLSPGKWYHFAYTVDPGWNTSLYINGRNETNFSEDFPPTTNNLPILIGDYNDPGYNFDGRIDQIRIFNYARTAAQVNWEYNQGKPYAWYKFDECQGDGIMDSSSNLLSGTWLGSAGGTQTSVGSCSIGTTNTAWSAGKNGKINSSLNFDGTDDRVQISNEPAFDFEHTQPFSLSAWVKINDSPAQGYTIWSKSEDNGTSSKGIQFVLTDQDYIDLDLCNGPAGCSYVESGTAISHGQWNHIITTYDGSGGCSGMRIYVNGNADNTICGLDDLGGGSILNNISPHIGESSNYAASNRYNFKGQIDDLRIYTYPLTPTQVKTLYNNGAANFASDFYIGKSYGGGKIAYIDSSGQHGLIAASSDQTAGPWGCSGVTTNATATAIGSGMGNTASILVSCATAGIAARVATQYTGGGYTDWYLPDKDELNALYANQAAIGGFSATYYWTSTENASINSWIQSFANGGQNIDTKGTSWNVRAVRAF